MVYENMIQKFPSAGNSRQFILPEALTEALIEALPEAVKMALKVALVVLFLAIAPIEAARAAEAVVKVAPSTRVGRDVTPVYGPEAAAEYMSASNPSSRRGSGDHYLAIHGGRIVSGEAWEWGQRNKQSDTGSYSAGVTYRVREWSTMDLNLRIDFNEYKIAGETPLKMSLLPLLIFPDASSKFPLYFGVGGGLGVFFKQVPDESQIAFDYQFLMGARFFDVLHQTGFFVETGMKNHLLLLTSGQLNGVFLTGGALFTF